MKKVLIIPFFALITSSFSNLQAQNDFAILEKNINIRAKGLTQKLNTEKDTLILESNTLINKVYAVNMNHKREINLLVKHHTVEIPLKNLSKGKHLFVVVQSTMRIVFVVKILGDNSVLLALEDDKLPYSNQ